MNLKSIQKDYIQKSRIFLYPLLGIRRGVSITPVHTFMVWEDVYTVNDHKFITVYHLRDDQEFKQFEEKMLLGNQFFENFFELENGKGAYVFDFASIKQDYKKVVHGKYSRLSSEHKKRVSQFFKNHHKHSMYVQSYLEPTKFINDYAKLLNVTQSLLREVGELCSLPDLNLEKLELKQKVFNFESVNNL